MANGSLQFSNQLAVKLGSSVFSVKGYLIPSLSKAAATDLAAQTSTSKDVMSFTFLSNSFSLNINFFFNLSAPSKSTLTPCSRILITSGNSFISNFQISSKD